MSSSGFQQASSLKRMTGTFENMLFLKRRCVIGLFMALSLSLAWFASKLEIDAGFTKLIPIEHPYMSTYLEYRDDFGSADRVIMAVMVKQGDMFTEGFIDTLDEITDFVFFLPGVDRTQVYSILTPNVRFIEIVEDGIRAGNVLPEGFQPDEAGFEQLRNNILKSDIVGRLVATGFTGAIVSARLQEFNPETGIKLDYIDVANRLEQLRIDIDARSESLYDMHIIGFAKVVGDIAGGAAEIVVFFLIALAVVGLSAMLYMKSLQLAAVLVVCSLLAVIWQLGIISALGYGIDPMSMLIPFLVFAIAMSHGVQITNATRAESVDGGSRLMVARSGFRRIVGPGVAALVSDIVGFSVISLIDVQVIREIAVLASIGVAGIILTNLCLLPVLLSYIDLGKRRAYGVRSLAWTNSKRFWLVISKVTQVRAAFLVIMVSAALAAGGVWYGSKVRIGDQQDGVPELRPDSQYNLDLLAITDNFHIGVDVLTVIAETSPDACVDYEVMKVLDNFEWKMKNVEGVQSVSGLAGTARQLSAAWSEGDPKWRTLPRNHYRLVQSVAPVPTSSGLLNADCSVMAVHIYTTDHTADTIERIVEAVAQFNLENASSPITFRLAAGNVGVMAATNEEVESSQFKLLGFVYMAVIAICLLTFRSLTSTLCVVIPLAIASLLTYGLMAILEIGLKISTLPVIALGCGIGVDYGIYIFSRIRYYCAQGMDFRKAYLKTLTTVGSGVIFTGLALAVSVATWLFSSLQFQADMGVILMFMFIVNMIGAIVLLPALGACMSQMKRGFKKPDHE